MLAKNQRLTRAADFRRTRGRGRQWRSPFFLAFVLPSSKPLPRVGIIVSAKIGKATVRKRAARILRAAYRQTLGQASGFDIVLIARPMIKGRTSVDMEREMKRLSRSLRS